MFYKIVRQIVATAFKVFFRKIYLVGKEKIPRDKPLLISCNHPMAFTEACLLACFLDRPLHFLVRGDVFDSKWRWFLDQTNQIPIYRFRDGFKNMRRNAESFSWAHRALAEGKVILIFSEGNTNIQKKLSPLQKGVARLAFGAYVENGVENLEIVPIGVNYEEGTRFRSDVMIQIGEPLPIKPYLSLYEEDNIQGIKKLTDDVYDAMLPLIIHFDNEDVEPIADEAFDILEQRSPDTLWPIVDADERRFIREKTLADKINEVGVTTEEGIFNLAKNLNVSLESPSILKRLMSVLLLIVTAPVALFGFLTNAIPFYLAKFLVGKKVKKKEFYTPVRLGLLLVLYIIWLLIILITGSFVVGWKILVFIWLPFLSGYFTSIWVEELSRLRQRSALSDVRLAK